MKSKLAVRSCGATRTSTGQLKNKERLKSTVYRSTKIPHRRVLSHCTSWPNDISATKQQTINVSVHKRLFLEILRKKGIYYLSEVLFENNLTAIFIQSNQINTWRTFPKLKKNGKHLITLENTYFSKPIYTNVTIFINYQNIIKPISYFNRIDSSSKICIKDRLP